MVSMLRSQGAIAALHHVANAADIGDLVTRLRPHVVVVEALWLHPAALNALVRTHRGVRRWVVRNHSALPFLANEGGAMEFLMGYAALRTRRVVLSCNDPRAHAELRAIVAAAHPDWSAATLVHRVVYLPNSYDVAGAQRFADARAKRALKAGVLDVGCFGAVRPLKNQLAQAAAALAFASRAGVRLRFHINASRVENAGSAVLRNLRALFAAQAAAGHELVTHGWLAHADFLALLAHMDVAMQVSLTETFNIVSADAAAVGVPLVVSAEVPWAPGAVSTSSPTSMPAIVALLGAATGAGAAANAAASHAALSAYVAESASTWRTWLSHLRRADK